MEKTQVIAALGALAQETRLDVFRLLVQTGPEGLAVGRIGKQLGLPSATLSFHLSQLKQAGLVSFRRDGRSLIYRANFATMADIMGCLTEHCGGGEAADCGMGGSACDPAARGPSKMGADA